VWPEGVAGLLSKWVLPWGSARAVEAWNWFLAFGALQAALQLFMPGSTFYGPTSPKGNQPVYKVRAEGGWGENRARGKRSGGLQAPPSHAAAAQ